MRPRPALVLALLGLVAAEPTGWNWSCRPGLTVCSRCTVTWTGGSGSVSAKVVDAAGSGSTCAVSATGDSCTWSVDLAPASIATVVVTSNSTDYTFPLGEIGCQANCAAFADVCAVSSSSAPSSSSGPSPSPSPSPSTDGPSPNPSPSTSGSATSDKPTDKPSQTTQKPDPGEKTDESKPEKKTTTKVSTAPPTQLTTTDENGHTTTIFVPGEEITSIVTVDEAEDKGKGLSTGAVAALASLGGLAGLALIVGGWYACRKSRRRSEEMELEDSILFGPRRHSSTAADPFLNSMSNPATYDTREVRGSPVVGRRTSAYADPYAQQPYGGPGIASTFPTGRYTDPFSQPSSPIMRPSSRTSAPSSPVIVPRTRSTASLDRLSRPSSLVLATEPSVSPTPGAAPPRYDSDDIAEFVTTDTPVTMRSLVPGRHAQHGGGGMPGRPRSWVDADDHNRRSLHEQMVGGGHRPSHSQRPSHGSREFDATHPLLSR